MNYLYIILIVAGESDRLLFLMNEENVMTVDEILGQAGIPLVMFMVCMYYAFRLIILNDVAVIRSKDKGPVRNQKKYSKTAGLLIVMLGLAALIMAILIFINLYIALAEIVLSIIIFVWLWKKMNDQYGT